MSVTDVHRTIDAVWRIESARLIAGLARMLRDVGLAEELAQDALVVALEQWPQTGVPDNPGAWLMTTAKHRAIDRLRRSKLLERKHAELVHELEMEQEQQVSAVEAALDDPIGDDLLRLMFTACHPVLTEEAQVALTLKLLAGLSTAQIARAFVQGEPTVAQRIVRAKRTLANARVPFEVPRGEELQERLAAVLQVIYLIFNEGYSATAGDDWTRPALCEEAMRLARMLMALAPAQREVHGLNALLELQASRLRARTDAQGRPILLLDQDRARWDWVLVKRGFDALARAQKLAGPPGPYELQAAIAACHASARTAIATDWNAIVCIYDSLQRLQPSPIVRLNRAVAVGMAQGPAPALMLVEAICAEGSLDGYHLLHAVRGDLLGKLGRRAEARVQFEAAAALATNQRERALLVERARAMLD